MLTRLACLFGHHSKDLFWCEGEYCYVQGIYPVCPIGKCKQCNKVLVRLPLTPLDKEKFFELIHTMDWKAVCKILKVHFYLSDIEGEKGYNYHYL